MKREESIPEGSALPSRGSGRGSGSANTNKSTGARDDMLETWCVPALNLSFTGCPVHASQNTESSQALEKALGRGMPWVWMHHL